jgi:hypothetical protein
MKLLEDAGEAFSEYQDRGSTICRAADSNSMRFRRSATRRREMSCLPRTRPKARAISGLWVALDAENEARAVLAHWRPQRRNGNRICVRSIASVSQQRTGHKRRSSRVPRGRLSRLRGRRATQQAVWRDSVSFRRVRQMPRRSPSLPSEAGA